LPDSKLALIIPPFLEDQIKGGGPRAFLPLCSQAVPTRLLSASGASKAASPSHWTTFSRLLNFLFPQLWKIHHLPSCSVSHYGFFVPFGFPVGWSSALPPPGSAVGFAPCLHKFTVPHNESLLSLSSRKIETLQWVMPYSHQSLLTSQNSLLGRLRRCERAPQMQEICNQCNQELGYYCQAPVDFFNALAYWCRIN